MPSGDPPLVAAARERRVDDVRALLGEAGAASDRSALDGVDRHGWTALHWLAGQGDEAEVAELLRRGADPAIVDQVGRDPYDVALGAGHRATAELLRAELLRRDPEIAPRFRWTPYCRGYLRADVARFGGWSDLAEDGAEPAPVDGSTDEPPVVFIHDDFTVTETVWRDQDVVVARPTPRFIDFCAGELGFEVPDELDLLPDAEEH